MFADYGQETEQSWFDKAAEMYKKARPSIRAVTKSAIAKKMEPKATVDVSTLAPVESETGKIFGMPTWVVLTVGGVAVLGGAYYFLKKD